MRQSRGGGEWHWGVVIIMVGGVHVAEENMSILCSERDKLRRELRKKREKKSRADTESQRNQNVLDNNGGR